jgi:uncharacterized membrane protein YeiB
VLAADSSRAYGFDVARAVAIMGMAVVNFDVMLDTDAASLPWIAAAVEFLYGRAAVTFVMLAGVSLSLMVRRSGSGRIDQALRPYLMRRCVLLLLAGLLITVWWMADILHFYAFFIACGIGLAGLSNKRLGRLTLSVAIISIPVCGILTAAYDQCDQLPCTDDLVWWVGAVLDVFISRNYSVIPWITFFMTGMVLGRLTTDNPVFHARCAAIGVAACLAIEVFSSVMTTWAESQGLTIAGNVWLSLIRSESFPVSPLFIFSAGASALTVIGLAMLVSSQPWSARCVPPIAAFGRCSLTMYVVQLILGAALRSRLYLYDYPVTTLHALGAAVLFCCVGICFSVCWLRFFRRGPLEALFYHIAIGRRRRFIRIQPVPCPIVAENGPAGHAASTSSHVV